MFTSSMRMEIKFDHSMPSPGIFKHKVKTEWCKKQKNIQCVSIVWAVKHQFKMIGKLL